MTRGEGGIMARFLPRPRCCGQRLPGRSWRLESGQKVFVRFELNGELNIPTLKFLWFEPRKGADGIHSARITLVVFLARIVGAQDQRENIVITEQFSSVSQNSAKEKKESAKYGRKPSQIILSLLVAVSIKRAAFKFFNGRSG